MKSFSIIFIALLFSHLSFSQIQFEKNPFDKEAPFSYIPVNEDLWRSYEKNLKSKSHDANLDLVKSLQFSKLKMNEKAEAYLILAENAFESGRPYLASLLVFEINKIFPLSNQSIRSLYLLEKIYQKHNIIDEVFLFENIFDQDINLNDKKIPRDLKSFISYLYLEKTDSKKFKIDQKAMVRFIQPDTEWQLRLDYKKALYELFNNRLDAAIEIFEKLLANKNTSEYLRRRTERQLARLLFEKGEFEKSFDYLKNLQFQAEDGGAILLERAWNKYYLRHYSKALGLLTALDSPLFINSMSPESYILKILIYKELCIYDSVFQIKNDFEKKYSKSINAIKKRQDLDKDNTLKRWALQNYVLKQEALSITGLRQDMKWFEDHFSGTDIYKYFKEVTASKEKQIQDRLAFKLKKELRKVADQLLNYNEQISFLDYQTKVDSLKIKSNSFKKNYSPETISFITFDRLYWNYVGELWIDELENLRVLVKSKCED